jgi:ClpP class serine protease
MITAKIVQRMYHDFWLISAQLHKQICDRMFAENALSFVEVDVKEVKPSVDGETAIIPIKGVIGKGLCDMEKAFGMVDVDDISEMVQWAMEDDSIKSVMFDIASPGGTVSGVPELAEQIRGYGVFGSVLDRVTGIRVHGEQVSTGRVDRSVSAIHRYVAYG